MVRFYNHITVLFIVTGRCVGLRTENPGYFQLSRLSCKRFCISQCSFILSRIFHVTHILTLFYVGELIVKITCQGFLT